MNRNRDLKKVIEIKKGHSPGKPTTERPSPAQTKPSPTTTPSPPPKTTGTP